MHTRPLGHLPRYGLTMQRPRQPHRDRLAKSKPALMLVEEAQEFLITWKIEENLPKEYSSTEFAVMQSWGTGEPASMEGRSKIRSLTLITPTHRGESEKPWAQDWNLVGRRNCSPAKESGLTMMTPEQ